MTEYHMVIINEYHIIAFILSWSYAYTAINIVNGSIKSPDTPLSLCLNNAMQAIIAIDENMRISD